MRAGGRSAAGAASLVLLLLVGCSGRDASPPAPVSREVNVYFHREGECDVQPFPRTVTAAQPIDFARAALESLLAGPHEDEVAQGFRSALPDSQTVRRHFQSHLAFGMDPGHDGGSLGILGVEEAGNRLLRVNFSREIEAYGDGEERLCPLMRQIQATVRQFDEYTDVLIQVDGKSRGVLQP